MHFTLASIQPTKNPAKKIQKAEKKFFKAIKCNKGSLDINSKSYLKSMNAFISTFTLTFTQRHNFYYFIFISSQKERKKWRHVEIGEGGVRNENLEGGMWHLGN
jgi:hypothetical protein